MPHTFTVPGVPIAKARPRFSARSGFARAYTPEKTVHYEALVALCAQQAGVTPLEGPVRIEVRAYWPMKGSPRKRTPRPVAWKVTKPDADNVLKAVLDGLEGIAYANDGQVVDARVRTYHAAQGDQARLEVDIAPVGAEGVDDE